MTKRAVQYLTDLRLLPVQGGVKALKRVASIGAFTTAGAPLVLSGKLSEAILDEFNQDGGEAPTGLNHLARGLSRQAIEALPPEPNDIDYHSVLLRHPDAYTPGKALSSDALIEIVDRQYVFMGSRVSIKVATSIGVAVDAPFFGWIDGWERGTSAKIRPAQDGVVMDSDKNPGWRDECDALEREAQAARDNAVGKLTVNISLAIRMAMDRLALHRDAKRRGVTP